MSLEITDRMKFVVADSARLWPLFMVVSEVGPELLVSVKDFATMLAEVGHGRVVLTTSLTLRMSGHGSNRGKRFMTLVTLYGLDVVKIFDVKVEGFPIGTNLITMSTTEFLDGDTKLTLHI
jgi:hypothetical protein